MTAKAATTPDRRTSSDSTVDNNIDGIEGQLKAVEVEPANNSNNGSNNNDNTQNEKSPSSTSNESPPQTANVSPPQQSEDPEASRTTLETFLVMFALCLALFLAALDMTIIATAIPTISRHFDSSAGYVWIGSAYLLGNAAFVPAWGKLSDIFGRKPVLLATVTVFWIGSLLCAVSTSMGMLIAARAIQGVGGGGTIALPNICISDLFSMRKRGMYFGILGVVWALASAIGPILGGVFTSRVSWRWCFYINLPLGGAAMVILIFILKLHNPRTPVKQGLAAIDWVGNLLVIGGTLMLLFGLEFGGVQFPWKSATVICLIVFGCVTIGLFAVWENTAAKYPLMPARLFHGRTNIAAYALSLMHAMTFMSGSYWLPLYYQAVVGATPILSGVYLLPYVLALSCTSATVGIVIKKTGHYKAPIMFGLGMMTLGFGLFIDLGPKANWAKIVVFQIIAGIGVGPNFQSPLIAIQNNVQPRDIGSATATFQFLRQIGTSTSVVIGGVIFNNVMQSQQADLARELSPELADKLSGANAASSVFLVRSLKGHEGEVARGAYWNALQTMYIVYTCFSCLAFLLSFLIKEKTLSNNHKEHKTGLQSLKTEKRKEPDAEKTAVVGKE
ncbi:Efflux pump dotC [Cladobotryum mycophilum]|uniref:Efflux pump dotC n=1 Tax=Cladobotryum mycophilum TaxID=491253 RepID=A0ABR0SKJ9_9HYPO